MVHIGFGRWLGDPDPFIIAPPQPSNLWFNLQIDSGITDDGTYVSSWVDSVNNNALAQTTEIDKPTLNSTNKLIGLDTVAFGGEYPHHRNLYKGDLLSGRPSSGNATTIWAMLFRPLASSGTGSGDTRYIFYTGHHYSGGGGGNAGMQQYWNSGELWSPFIENNLVDLGVEATLGAWNILIFKYQPLTGFTLYLNGAPSGVFTALAQGNGNWSEMRLGAFTVDVRGWSGSLAALMSWKDATFSDDDYYNAYLYLKIKYGL